MSSDSASETHPASQGCWMRWVMLLGLILAGSGCRVVQQEGLETKSMLQSLLGAQNGGGGTNAMEVLQSEVMRGADLYVGTVAQATAEFRRRNPTPAARLAGQQWKLLEATAAYVNATGENPLLDAVDMAVLATLSRYIIEDEWVGKEFGESARPLLEAHLRLEQETWKILGPFLGTEQLSELKAVLEEYRRRYPGARLVAAVRLPELAAAMGHNQTPGPAAKKSSSIFNLLYLDPLAGLDPATQAVEQTRLLALRAMYYAQRAPMLLGWQVELTTYQLAAQPESQQVLTDLNRVSGSAESFSKTTEILPGLIHTEREAAIQQFFDGVSRERTQLIADLNAQESALRQLLPQVRETLAAGTGMANSLNTTIGSLDGFVRNVASLDAGSASPARPFDIREYGAAAERIGVAAKELNGALASLDRAVPGISGLGDKATADAKSVVTHAFLLALVWTVATAGVSLLVIRALRRPVK